MELLIKLGIFLILATVGYWRGRRNERDHLRLLDAEEDAVADVLIFATRYPPPSAQPLDPVLVSGSAVIASDFFRLLVANLRKIVGGNYRAYEQLMERGRRHAIIRLKQAAKARGATMVFNVRIVTSRISDSRHNEATQVEVLAYGTALIPARGAVAESLAHYVPGLPIAEAKPEQEAFKHPFSRRWLLGVLAMALYIVFEAGADRLMDQQWRYAFGAPWLIFFTLAIAVAGLICWRSIRAKTVASTYVVMTALTVLVLTLGLYHATLRVNALLSAGPQSVRYTVQAGGALHPVDPAWPVVRLEYYSPDGEEEYWIQLPVGQKVELTLLRGALGIYQYDLKPLSPDYERFSRAHSF